MKTLGMAAFLMLAVSAAWGQSWYGLQENGGTHLFVLAKEDPLAAGYPKVAKMAVKEKKVSLEGDLGVPAIAALAFTGLKKFSDRRSRVEAEAKKAKE